MPGNRSPYTIEQRRAAVDRARVIGYKAASQELVPPVTDSCVNLWRKRLGIPYFDSPGQEHRRRLKEGKPEIKPFKDPSALRGYLGEKRKRRNIKPQGIPPPESDPFLRVDECPTCKGALQVGPEAKPCPACVLAPCGRKCLTAGLPRMPPIDTSVIPETGRPREHECYGCDGCGRWRRELGATLLNRCAACWGTGRDSRNRATEIKAKRRATQTKCSINLP